MSAYFFQGDYMATLNLSTSATNPKINLRVGNTTYALGSSDKQIFTLFSQESYRVLSKETSEDFFWDRLPLVLTPTAQFVIKLGFMWYGTGAFVYRSFLNADSVDKGQYIKTRSAPAFCINDEGQAFFSYPTSQVMASPRICYGPKFDGAGSATAILKYNNNTRSGILSWGSVTNSFTLASNCEFLFFPILVTNTNGRVVFLSLDWWDGVS